MTTRITSITVETTRVIKSALALIDLPVALAHYAVGSAFVVTQLVRIGARDHRSRAASSRRPSD